LHLEGNPQSSAIQKLVTVHLEGNPQSSAIQYNSTGFMTWKSPAELLDQE
jgi:hypothetical protein